MRADCPYCGRLVAVDKARFRHHNTNTWGDLCPMVGQRIPVAGVDECDDEDRARLLADLAWQVQDSDPAKVWTYLTCLSDGELQRLLMFALAALPVDRTVDEMWGWVKDLPISRLKEAV